MFCAVAYGDKVATSPDGLVWILRSLPISSNWCDICWVEHKKVFCAISENDDKAVTSSDGITWTHHMYTTANSFR